VSKFDTTAEANPILFDKILIKYLKPFIKPCFTAKSSRAYLSPFNK